MRFEDKKPVYGKKRSVIVARLRAEIADDEAHGGTFPSSVARAIAATPYQIKWGEVDSRPVRGAKS